jgi:hypothetical protein
MVAVEAGLSITVTGLSCWVGVRSVVEGPVTWTHPLGEHWSSLGQHPPPASAEHSTEDGKHLGGLNGDASYWHSDCEFVELQQKMADGVNVVG